MAMVWSRTTILMTECPAEYGPMNDESDISTPSAITNSASNARPDSELPQMPTSSDASYASMLFCEPCNVYVRASRLNRHNQRMHNFYDEESMVYCEPCSCFVKWTRIKRHHQQRRHKRRHRPAYCDTCNTHYHGPRYNSHIRTDRHRRMEEGWQEDGYWDQGDEQIYDGEEGYNEKGYGEGINEDGTYDDIEIIEGDNERNNNGNTEDGEDENNNERKKKKKRADASNERNVELHTDECYPPFYVKPQRQENDDAVQESGDVIRSGYNNDLNFAVDGSATAHHNNNDDDEHLEENAEIEWEIDEEANDDDNLCATKKTNASITSISLLPVSNDAVGQRRKQRRK